MLKQKTRGWNIIQFCRPINYKCFKSERECVCVRERERERERECVCLSERKGENMWQIPMSKKSLKFAFVANDRIFMHIYSTTKIVRTDTSLSRRYSYVQSKKVPKNIFSFCAVLYSNWNNENIYIIKINCLYFCTLQDIVVICAHSISTQTSGNHVFILFWQPCPNRSQQAYICSSWAPDLGVYTHHSLFELTYSLSR